jgi:hypothetical protein
MARRSKQQIKEKKRALRYERKKRHYEIIIEEAQAGRVICETCGTQQVYTISGSSDYLAPCVGPFDLGICPGEICITVAAYNEETIS